MATRLNNPTGGSTTRNPNTVSGNTSQPQQTSLNASLGAQWVNPPSSTVGYNIAAATAGSNTGTSYTTTGLEFGQQSQSQTTIPQQTIPQNNQGNNQNTQLAQFFNK